MISPLTLTRYFLFTLFCGFSRNVAILGLLVTMISPSDKISSLPTVTTLGMKSGNNLNKLFCAFCSLFEET